jgi:hypothetical protein
MKVIVQAQGVDEKEFLIFLELLSDDIAIILLSFPLAGLAAAFYALWRYC